MNQSPNRSASRKESWGRGSAVSLTLLLFIFISLSVIAQDPSNPNASEPSDQPSKNQVEQQDKEKDSAPGAPESSSSQKEEDWGMPLIEKVEQLIETLESDNTTQVRKAQQQLLQIGQPAVPQLEAKIRQKGAKKYYDLIEQIELLTEGVAASSGNQKESDGNSKDSVEKQSEFSVREEIKSLKSSNLSHKEVKTFYELLSSRYRDALNAFQNERYREARKIAKSIKTLAPDHPLEKRIEKFIIRCGEEIIQESLVRATVIVDKTHYEWGETVKITYRIKNVSDRVVGIYFTGLPEDLQISDNLEQGKESGSEKAPDRGKEKNLKSIKTAQKTTQQNPISVEYVVTEWDLRGNSLMTNDYETLSVPEWIQLAPGASWETNSVFKTSNLGHRLAVRMMRIKAKARPAVIRKGKNTESRWIKFDPADVEVYPIGMREAIPATMRKIKGHMNAGNLTDVFFLTFLLPQKKHRKAIAYFLKVLPHLKEQPARTIMFLLRKLTGKNMRYRVETWTTWGKKQYGVSPGAYSPPGNEKSKKTKKKNFNDRKSDEKRD